jgi:sulfite oxidase
MFGKQGLIVRSEMPFNGEPQVEALRQHAITPREIFFVRNHGNVPEIDPASYRLRVAGRVGRGLNLSLDQLRNEFPPVTLTATVQCAGNRRRDLIAVAPIPGEVPWDAGAISTARWRGAPLRDVLSAAGVEDGSGHVAFLSFDQVERDGQRFGFGGSIPLAKALSAEVLLAYEMNGAPLPPVHGFPLRVLVPGYIGARSVKWLAEITVQDQLSDNYFHARAYRLFPPHVGPTTVDWSEGMPLGEVPVNAVICTPAHGATVPAGAVKVEGYALAGGGRSVERVDVSADGGETWTIATLVGEGLPWSWRFWEAQVRLPAGETEIAARAVDSASQTQPETARGIWNFKGYMNNAWHRVSVTGR